MGAALTLLVLLAGSLVIVRIASVALRLTGLPDHVARFQSISALTGAGFTTTESEAIVNFPIRRKVIVSLMIFGNLGLVSVLSTFVIAFADTTGDTDAMIKQGVLIVGAIAFIAFVMTNKTLDKLLCGFVSMILQKFMNSGNEKFHPILFLDKNFSIAEHVYRGSVDLGLDEIVPSGIELNILSVRGTEQHHYDSFGPHFKVALNETLICFGSDQSHQHLAEHLAQKFPFQADRSTQQKTSK